MFQLFRRQGGPWLVTGLLLVVVTGCGNAVSTSSGSGDEPASVSARPSNASDSIDIAYAVAGTVRTADGAPVKHAMVAATSLDEPGKSVPELAVLTDDEGAYRWPASLEPGRYRLSVATSDGTGSVEVEVTADGGASADLVLGK